MTLIFSCHFEISLVIVSILTLLSRAVMRESFLPTLLFVGPNGVGKRRTAMALAQAVNCEQPVSSKIDSAYPIDEVGRAIRRMSVSMPAASVSPVNASTENYTQMFCWSLQEKTVTLKSSKFVLLSNIQVIVRLKGVVVA